MAEDSELVVTVVSMNVYLYKLKASFKVQEKVQPFS